VNIPSAVEKDVHGSYRHNQRLDRRRVGHVEDTGLHRWIISREPFQRGLVDVRRNDGGAFSRKGKRSLPANTLGGGGNQTSLSVKPAIHSGLPLDESSFHAAPLGNV
jgi:hypothetical protein